MHGITFFVRNKLNQLINWERYLYWHNDMLSLKCSNSISSRVVSNDINTLTDESDR